MNLRLTAVCLFLFSLTLVNESYSQGRKLYSGQTKTRLNASIPISRKIAYPWTWYVGLGSASYFGQLCDTGDCFASQNYQFNLGLRYRFTNRISAGGSFRAFRVSASDTKAPIESGRPGRNISMRSYGYELMGYGMFDFIPTISRFMGDKADQYNRRNFIVPYATLGVGLLYFEPQGLDPLTKQYVNVAKLITYEEKRNNPYSQIVPVVSAGLGARMKISEFFDLGADFIFTQTFTDNLDDVKGRSKYPQGNFADNDFNTRSLDNRLADPSFYPGGALQPRDENSTSKVQPRRGGDAQWYDSYFLINVRLDYTMYQPFAFGKQKRHRRFAKGKGVKHHQFDRK